LEFGALDFGVLPGFLGERGFFAMAGIWDESGVEKRAKPARIEFAKVVMPGLVPGIHVLGGITQERRGWPGQARP
jgi:hypothetical protein